MPTCMLGYTPIILVFPLILAGCYDTFTREDLPSLDAQPIVLWTNDGKHYHLRLWSIDSTGSIQATGLLCTSTETRFNHALVNAEEFSGSIPQWSVTQVRTSAVQTSGDVVFLVVGAVAAGVLLAVLAFSGL